MLIKSFNLWFNFRIQLDNIKCVLKDSLNIFFVSSKPLDNASKLAQLVEKKLENYYKIDEKSLIKVTYKKQIVVMLKICLISL